MLSSGRMTLPLFIDSDNAMGSPSGDVDDGFALAALLCAKLDIVALASIFGNTTEPRAFENNRTIGELCGYRGPLLRGARAPGSDPTEASRALDTPQPLRIAALGPLTNVATAIRQSSPKDVRELVMVGSNSDSRGAWPPLWPYEFNLVKDRQATRLCFESNLPITIFPLNVASKFLLSRRDVEDLKGPLGSFLAGHTKRWFRHLLWTRARLRFPAYDLLAALYLIDPSGIELQERRVAISDSGAILYRRGSRAVQVATSFDQKRLWKRFCDMIGGS